MDKMKSAQDAGASATIVFNVLAAEYKGVNSSTEVSRPCSLDCDRAERFIKVSRVAWTSTPRS